MGGSLSIRNETGIELIVTLSQAGPLHWERVPPWSEKTISCGKVWFTVDARLWDGKEPSGWEVAKPFVIGFGAAGAVVATAGVGLALAAPAAGAGAVGATAIATSEGAAVVSTTALFEGTATIAAGAGIAAGGAATGTATALLSSAANKSASQTAVSENTEKWLAYTPSEKSAEWLAMNNVICVVPVSEKGVYANGKTVTVNYDMESSSGESRMTLKLTGI